MTRTEIALNAINVNPMIQRLTEKDFSDLEKLIRIIVRQESK